MHRYFDEHYAGRVEMVWDYLRARCLSPPNRTG
jgi:hypothetical protein